MKSNSYLVINIGIKYCIIGLLVIFLISLINCRKQITSREIPIIQAQRASIGNLDTIHNVVSSPQISMVDMWENRFGDRDFKRMLEDLKTEKDPGAKENLMFELGNSYDTSAVQPLIDILHKDRWAPVRTQSAKSLIILGLGSADTLNLEFVDRKFGEERAKALLLLKENKIIPALKTSLHDKDIYVVYNSAAALVALGDTDNTTLKILLDIFRKKNIKKWKMEFIPRPDIPKADQPKLKEMQEHDKAAIPGNALEILKKVRSQYIIDELTKALQDKDSWVREKAKNTLEELRSTTPIK
jgi:HEAT repeat protein